MARQETAVSEQPVFSEEESEVDLVHDQKINYFEKQRSVKW